MKTSSLLSQASQPGKSLALTALVLATSGVCYGQIIVNFSPTWSAVGDASTQGPNFNGGSSPASGLPFEGVVTTINPIDSPPISGVSAVPASVLETFLGLAPNSLNQTFVQYPHDFAEEGSAYKQTFTAQAGDTFTFKWNFYTAEALISPAGHDYGFYTLQPQNSNATITPLANSLSGLHTAPGPAGLLSTFSSETGYRSTTITIPSTGTWTLGFGVIEDSYNPGADSALAIASPVPEPWAWSSVTGLALGCWAFCMRRSRQSVNARS